MKQNQTIKLNYIKSYQTNLGIEIRTKSTNYKPPKIILKHVNIIKNIKQIKYKKWRNYIKKIM